MDRYNLGQWIIDPTACTLTSTDNTKTVEPRCMELLMMLIEANGETVSRSQIMEQLWDGRFVSDHALNNLVAMLRKHLKGDSEIDFIKTRPKRGYQLTVSVQKLDIEPSEAASFNELQVDTNTLLQQGSNVTSHVKSHSNTTQKREPENKKESSNKILYSVGIFAVFLAVVLAGLFISENRGSTEPPSIAILSFDTFNEKSEALNYTEGLVEEVIYQLSETTRIKVVPRSSSSALKDKALDVKQMAEALDADYLVEGSLREQDGALRITSRLINGKTGDQLWSRVFASSLGNDFSSQNSISAELSQVIIDSLSDPNALSLLEKDSIPYAARLHLLRGRRLNAKGRMEDYIQALDEFKMASKIAPNYLEAHTNLALNYLILAQRKRLDPEDANKLANESIERALAIDPENAQSHALKATYYQNVRDYEAAEASYRKALQSQPNLYIANLNYANLLLNQKRYSDSLKLYKEVKRIAPTSTSARFAIGDNLVGLGRFDEALAEIRDCVSLFPNYQPCIAYLAYIQRMTGKNEAADTTYQNYTDLMDTDAYWYKKTRAWHDLWQNKAQISAQGYKDIIDEHGIEIDKYNPTLAMWHSQSIDKWITNLTRIQESRSDEVMSNLSLAYYFNNQCKSAIPVFEELKIREPSLFEDLATLANTVSYRIALAHCYKSTGQNTEFKEELLAAETLLDSIPENNESSLGFEFVKGQFFALSGEKEKLQSIKQALEKKSPFIQQRIMNDPIYKSALSIQITGL